MENKAYVKCEIAKGMFESELAYHIKTESDEYAGFADKSDVIPSKPLSNESKNISGKVRVYPIEELGDKIRVYLPGVVMTNESCALIPKRMFIS